MQYENILYEERDGIAVVTVNREDKLNALNSATDAEIGAAFDRIAATPEVRAAIVTGAGKKAFVAGADINELARFSAVQGKEAARRGQRILDKIERSKKPVIAAVNGFALGGGMELALACHFRYAAENAKLGLPEVKLGIIPGHAGTQRLTRVVGKGLALELTTTGEMIDAREALRIGLVNRVLPQEELMAACEKTLRIIMANGPVAVGLAIEAVNASLELSYEEGCDLEAALFGLCCATKDQKEGMNAFLEKRKADFTGE